MLVCAGSLPIGVLASPAGARSQLTTSAVPAMTKNQRNTLIHRKGRFSARRSSCVLITNEGSRVPRKACRTLSRAGEAEMPESPSNARKPALQSRGRGRKKARTKRAERLGSSRPEENRFSKRQRIWLVDFAASRRVRNVMDHLNAFTGGTQCCQSHRAAPAIL